MKLSTLKKPDFFFEKQDQAFTAFHFYFVASNILAHIMMGLRCKSVSTQNHVQSSHLY